MIFNSFTYVLFLVAAVGLYWTLPRRARLVMLFAASVTFYGFWRFDFVPLLMASVVTDYVAARIIERARSQARRKIALIVSLSVNLGLLGFFKYFYFFTENAVSLASVLGVELTAPAWVIILPIGISFYTFQSMSYTIDVYRGFIRAERDFLLFANYVIFFPQLVAGPILRAGEIIWQLDRRPRFDVADISAGIQRIVGGLFLKVVLADNLAGFVDDGFSGNLAQLTAIDVMTLATLFGFQIYFDFAGYSHIALGSARLMGIRFPENFDHPYSAASPRDFWRRWHISLSSWIRDYLYLPLAGAQVQDRSTGGLVAATQAGPGQGRGLAALFLTWAIMGLWHGAAWAFMVWGLWHAALIALYRVTRTVRPRLPGWLRTFGGWAWTFPMAMLAWVPFRTQSLDEALVMWGRLLEPSGWFRLGMRENTYLVAFLVFVGVMAAPYVRRALAPVQTSGAPAVQVVHAAGFAIVLAIVLVYLRPIDQFIYFQF